MSFTHDPFPNLASVPISHGLRWRVDGIRLWRRAPFKLFFFCLFTLLVEVVIQRIPWVGGWTFSIILLPLLNYGILLDLDELARQGRIR